MSALLCYLSLSRLMVPPAFLNICPCEKWLLLFCYFVQPSWVYFLHCSPARKDELLQQSGTVFVWAWDTSLIPIGLHVFYSFAEEVAGMGILSNTTEHSFTWPPGLPWSACVLDENWDLPFECIFEDTWHTYMLNLLHERPSLGCYAWPHPKSALGISGIWMF